LPKTEIDLSALPKYAPALIWFVTMFKLSILLGLKLFILQKPASLQPCPNVNLQINTNPNIK
jgi:hypothetical protein